MAALTLPQDVTEHLEAAIQLYNKRVHLRFLDESELLLAFNLPTAAVLVAGVVLEAILTGPREQGRSENRERMEKWLELRKVPATTPLCAKPACPWNSISTTGAATASV